MTTGRQILSSHLLQELFCQIISFLLIHRAFHLCDNQEYIHHDNPNHDPLFKILKFYLHLQTMVEAIYTPKKKKSSSMKQ